MPSDELNQLVNPKMENLNKQFSIKLTVMKWTKEKHGTGNVINEVTKFKLLQFNESKKYKREIEDWLVTLKFISTKDNIETFKNSYGANLPIDQSNQN